LETEIEFYTLILAIPLTDKSDMRTGKSRKEKRNLEMLF
jgi:hypothetical protein